MPANNQWPTLEKDHLTSFEKYQRNRIGSQSVTSNPFVALQEELRLNRNTEEAWNLGQQFCLEYTKLKASSLYTFSKHLALSFGWIFGGRHCGYLASKSASGASPDTIFIQPGNDTLLRSTDANGNPRQWIYRVHFVHPHRQVNAFFEYALTL